MERLLKVLNLCRFYFWGSDDRKGVKAKTYNLQGLLSLLSFVISICKIIILHEFISHFVSDKAKLAECMDIIGEMYKVKFNPKDYCKVPVDTYGIDKNIIDYAP